jgi:hypothetical protein
MYLLETGRSLEDGGRRLGTLDTTALHVGHGDGVGKARRHADGGLAGESWWPGGTQPVVDLWPGCSIEGSWRHVERAGTIVAHVGLALVHQTEEELVVTIGREVRRPMIGRRHAELILHVCRGPAMDGFLLITIWLYLDLFTWEGWR